MLCVVALHTHAEIQSFFTHEFSLERLESIEGLHQALAFLLLAEPATTPTPAHHNSLTGTGSSSNGLRLALFVDDVVVVFAVVVLIGV